MPERWASDLKNAIKVVKDHPVVVIFFTVIGTITLTLTVLMPYHTLIVESKDATIEKNASIVQEKDATIEMMKATVENANVTIKKLEERLGAKDEQLVAKDKQVGEYRNRAQVIQESQTTYARLAKRDLKQKALVLADKIRGLVSLYQESAVNTRQRPDEDWDKYMARSSKASSDIMNRYYREYKVEAILVKDELLSRLSRVKINRDSFAEWSYDSPTNFFGLTAIADDLEKLAKSLPE